MQKMSFKIKYFGEGKRLYTAELYKVISMGAHQSASILSTAKFGGGGRLASLECQLTVPEAACSILSACRERASWSAVAWLPLRTYHGPFSANECAFLSLRSAAEVDSKLSARNGSKKGAFSEGIMSRQKGACTVDYVIPSAHTDSRHFHIVFVRAKEMMFQSHHHWLEDLALHSK